MNSKKIVKYKKDNKININKEGNGDSVREKITMYKLLRI